MDTTTTTTPRPRWKLSLRGVLALVFLTTLPITWLGRELYRARWEREFSQTAAEFRGSVTHESEREVKANQGLETYPGENWLRETLDIESKPRLTTVCLVSDESKPLIAKLPEVRRLKGVVLRDMTLSDSEISTLLALPHLERLILHDVGITPEQLARFVDCRELQKVQLDGSNATDTNLEIVGQMRQLEEVIVCDGTATNEGAAHLSHLTKLHSFTALRTEIDYAAIATFSRMTMLTHLQFRPNQPQPEWKPQWTTILGGLPKFPRDKTTGAPILVP